MLNWTKTCTNTLEWMKSSIIRLPIFIVPNWKMEFHVHVDTSNFVIGVMLGQNINNIIDYPIYYTK
jgi:hypothetical protein